jgi:hypothetical protein
LRVNWSLVVLLSGVREGRLLLHSPPRARSSRWKIGDDLKELRCVSQVFEIAYLAGPCVMLGRLRSSHSNGMQELYRLAWSSMATRPL